MKPGRSLFQAHNWRPGTPDEYWEAGSGYIAYCGVSEVDEENETVTHLPSVALVPNLILKGQLRSITLSGGLADFVCRRCSRGGWSVCNQSLGMAESQYRKRRRGKWRGPIRCAP